jgi:hypothetical protein
MAFVYETGRADKSGAAKLCSFSHSLSFKGSVKCTTLSRERREGERTNTSTRTCRGTPSKSRGRGRQSPAGRRIRRAERRARPGQSSGECPAACVRTGPFCAHHLNHLDVEDVDKYALASADDKGGPLFYVFELRSSVRWQGQEYWKPMLSRKGTTFPLTSAS